MIGLIITKHYKHPSVHIGPVFSTKLCGLMYQKPWKDQETVLHYASGLQYSPYQF